MDKVSVVAITKNGIAVGRDILRAFPDWTVMAPAKLSDGGGDVTWYAEPTAEKAVELFKASDALVCVFSLGAVMRLLAPHLGDKKTDPAVIVIDDKATFVISALSGHLGGANMLAERIARRLDSVPVITTAADVNKTIAVDLLGRDLGWRIDDESTVTRVSAYMVNEEKIGVFQDAGKRDWYRKLPKNVELFDDLDAMKNSGAKGFLVISDRILEGDFLRDAVVYRPPTLVMGVGLHWDTPKDTIKEGIRHCLERHGLSLKSVFRLASIKKPLPIQGLAEAASDLGLDMEYLPGETLAEIDVPNPSDTVKAFEGTRSVSEAAALKISGGELVVEKQKFPPNLTIAVARRAQ